MAQEIHVEGPTRLVSVGKSPSFDDVCLRAFEADNLRPKYVNLSYRLGGAGDFKFTTEIPEIMKSRIQINFLAKTIRQAIALTRRLGWNIFGSTLSAYSKIHVRIGPMNPQN